MWGLHPVLMTWPFRVISQGIYRLLTLKRTAKYKMLTLTLIHGYQKPTTSSLQADKHCCLKDGPFSVPISIKIRTLKFRWVGGSREMACSNWKVEQSWKVYRFICGYVKIGGRVGDWVKTNPNIVSYCSNLEIRTEKWTAPRSYEKQEIKHHSIVRLSPATVSGLRTDRCCRSIVQCLVRHGYAGLKKNCSAIKRFRVVDD